MPATDIPVPPTVMERDLLLATFRVIGTTLQKQVSGFACFCCRSGIIVEGRGGGEAGCRGSLLSGLDGQAGCECRTAGGSSAPRLALGRRLPEFWWKLREHEEVRCCVLFCEHGGPQGMTRPTCERDLASVCGNSCSKKQTISFGAVLDSRGVVG